MFTARYVLGLYIKQSALRLLKVNLKMSSKETDLPLTGAIVSVSRVNTAAKLMY